MNRRDLLKCLAASGGLSLLPRIGWGAAPANQPLWIHVQASGGWDTALFCDPKPSLRPALANKQIYLYGVPTLDAQGKAITGTEIVGGNKYLNIRETPGGGIKYLALADLHGDPSNPNHPYRCFFPSYHDRITLFNGVDTATNNHVVGERYCASGSSNESFPCFGAQIGAALGLTKALPFLTLGGYDETASLVSGTPMTVPALRSLLMALNPNDLNGDNAGTDYLLDPAMLQQVRNAQQTRLARLKASQKLPGQQQGLAALERGQQAVPNLAQLKYGVGYYDETRMIQIALDAYRQGLAVSLTLTKGGFDSHGDAEGDATPSLYNLFQGLDFILRETEAPSNGKSPIPVVILVSSDFGRTPYYSNGGTDHWPVTSMMVIQNKPALALGFNLPTNTTIGASTDGNATTGMLPMKLNAQSLKLDSNGIKLTPGHVISLLRRLAGISQSPILKAFPLQVGTELNLG